MKVLLVDDSPVVCARLRTLLEEIPGIEKVEDAGSVAQARARFDSLQPDVVILDIRLPDGVGIDVLADIKRLRPATQVIMQTNYPTDQYRDRCLALGADYFLDKAADTQRLEDVLVKLAGIDRSFAPSTSDLQPGKENKMKSILVVDDSPTMRRMVRASLQSLPVRFHEAENGLSAIEQLTLYDVDLMTLDLNMPDMHGIEVLQFVRNQPSFSKLPILVVTARGDIASRELAMANGANRYISKPFNAAELLNQVRQMLGLEGEVSHDR